MLNKHDEFVKAAITGLTLRLGPMTTTEAGGIDPKLIAKKAHDIAEACMAEGVRRNIERK
jgi:hypothetical protein